MAFATIRMRQEDNKNAISGYEIAKQNPNGVPMKIFNSLMSVYIEANKTSEASDLIAKAEEAFGTSEPALYPLRIRLAQKQNQPIEPLLNGCRLSGDARIAEMCRYWAQHGVSNQSAQLQ